VTTSWPGPRLGPRRPGELRPGLQVAPTVTVKALAETSLSDSDSEAAAGPAVTVTVTSSRYLKRLRLAGAAASDWSRHSDGDSVSELGII
jgi:hypothetical protein